jgi:DNA processing protein
MAQQMYWLWYSLRVQELSPRTAENCLHRLGGDPEQIYRMSPAELKTKLQPRYSMIFADKDMRQAQRVALRCQEKGIRILTWEDSDYPVSLREIPQPPRVLYVRGRLPDFQLAITLVGTRHATDYGRKVAADLAGGLARAGCTVVSGMALGIDGIVNGAALDAGGQTVAVLGCGADVCYPSEHRGLMEQIIRRGAVITEYPPGTEPKGYHFPIRNRIMSGLSLATVVIEAPERSGALITARHALEQGREVFAVPGSIYEKNARGGLALLRDGASLATGVRDILLPYGSRLRQEWQQTLFYETREKERKPKDSRREKTTDDQKKQPAKAPEKTVKWELSQLSPEEKKVYEAVAQGADRPDMIVEHTDLTAAQVMAAVTMMEISGVILRDSGRIFLNL